MASDRRAAVVLGVLVVSSMVFGIMNTVPILEKPDYLERLAANEAKILNAVFFQAAFAVVYVGIAVLPLAMLKRYREGLATAYFGFRIIGAAFSFLGMASLLLLLSLGRSFAAGGTLDSQIVRLLGELLRTGRDMINHIAVVLPWCIGGLILYHGLYAARLVPAWLSIWGIVATSLGIVSTILFMLNFIRIVSPTYMLMMTPTALVDLALALFLIIKGFRPIATASGGKTGP
jgi:hypothetical protein